MFKHVLIPTDGSAVAAKAIQAGVALAKEMGAKVTGLYAEGPPLQLHKGGGLMMVQQDVAAELERRSREYAERSVAEIRDAAAQRKCDVICMGSHGHRGFTGLVLGSVTNKVLTHSNIPVVVFR